jgi:hypothetical protein
MTLPPLHTPVILRPGEGSALETRHKAHRYSAGLISAPYLWELACQRNEGKALAGAQDYRIAQKWQGTPNAFRDP